MNTITRQITSFLKLAAFGGLVVLTILLATQVSETAAIVLANVDPLGFNENFCYSACTFVR